MGHPDFRLGGKIFATLNYPTEEWGMVKLSPQEQDEFVRMQPSVFVPVKGAWGRQGCTNVRLEVADPGTVEEALRSACGRLRPAAKEAQVNQKLSRTNQRTRKCR